MVLNKKIVMRESAIAGHGLYAVERISKGEIVRSHDARATESTLDLRV